MRTSLCTFWTQTLGCELVDVTMDAERCGAAALPAEREAMRRASVQTARLFAAAQGILEPGLTLREARIELRRCAYRLGCFGASGDTAFFKKHSNINGFRTPEQRNYLYSALLKQSISAAIARFISR